MRVVWSVSAKRVRAVPREFAALSPTARFSNGVSSTDVLEGLGAYATSTMTLVPTDRDPFTSRSAASPPQCSRCCVRPPCAARLFDPADAPMGTTGMPATPSVAIVSFGLWQQWFGGEEAAIGRTVQIDGLPFTIVGVMPRGFAFPDNETRLWIPMPVGSVLGAEGSTGASRSSPRSRV